MFFARIPPLPGEEPLEVRWGGPDNPPPVRVLRLSSRAAAALPDVPPWISSGPADRAFDFCGRMRRLLEDITSRIDELRHVRLERILVGMIRARNSRRHGLQARVTPLRFPRGQLTRQRGSFVYQVQRWFVDGREYLYHLTFCVPRFLDQDFDDKFVTLFHELYHIGPACNGDLRRHDGRYPLHTHSQRNFDKHMAELARRYLAGRPDTDLFDFLRLNFAQLCRRHSGVEGLVIPRAKIIPLHQAVPAHPRKAPP